MVGKMVFRERILTGLLMGRGSGWLVSPHSHQLEARLSPGKRKGVNHRAYIGDFDGGALRNILNHSSRLRSCLKYRRWAKHVVSPKGPWNRARQFGLRTDYQERNDAPSTVAEM